MRSRDLRHSRDRLGAGLLPRRKSLFHLRGAGLSQIWVLDLESGQTSQLTAHDERVSLLRRAPNDDRLVYAIDTGGDERHQLWLLQTDATAQALTTESGVIHGMGAWAPQGDRIAYTANDRDPAHFDVLVMELATGTTTRLFEGTHEASVGAWNPDDRLVAVMDRATGDQRPVLVAATREATPLPRAGAARYASLRWDGAGLLGLSDAGGRQFMALCRVDLETGAAEAEYAPDGRDVEAWALSSTALLATVENDRGYAVLRVGPRTGERPVVESLPKGVVSDLAWSGDGAHLAFTASAPTQPGALWVWQAGHAQPVWKPACPLALRDVEPVSWTSFDGQTVEGWFAKPGGEAPASGWPAVIWVHGGPASQARATFRPDMQALLAQGYALLMPNVRGSTGYGRTWMEADDVDRRLDAVHDLAAAHTWLTSQPTIDPARIAVMGQSYGGYMVLAAVTEHPTLWRCAIDLYGIADFTTLLAATGEWRRAHRAAEYGDPVRHRALFDRISPIRHVNRIDVPMLVLHGLRDPRVAIGESEQVVAALQARGRTVEYEVFDNAGHGFVREADKARVYRAVARFLDRHL